MPSLSIILIFLLPLKSPKLASAKYKLPLASVLKKPPLTPIDSGNVNVYESPDKVDGATILIVLTSPTLNTSELSILTVDISNVIALLLSFV